MPDRGQRLTLTGGADRVGVRLPDRGQAADAHRGCRSCERSAAGSWLGGCVATPGPQATMSVNARRANGGQPLPERGQAADAHRRCLSCERPAAESRPGGYVETPGPLATTPVNAARANGGTRGRKWQHLPDRGQAATSRRRGLATTPVNAATANGGTRGGHLPDRGQAADDTAAAIGGLLEKSSPLRSSKRCAYSVLRRHIPMKRRD